MIDKTKINGLAILVLIALISSSSVLAANDPGHDTLYVELIGDVMTGFLNISSTLFVLGDITTNKSVGINTTTPLSTLHVNGTARFEGQLNMTGSRITNLGTPIAGTDATTRTYVDAQVGGGGTSGWNDTGILVELVAGTDSVNATNVYIDNTVQGNTLFVNENAVGIGTASPSHKLNVVGNANITGNLYADNVMVDDSYKNLRNPHYSWGTYDGALTNFFFKAEKRFNVTFTGEWGNVASSNLFDGDWESWFSNYLEDGLKGNITINLIDKGEYGSNGLVYPYGFFLLSFYGNWGPKSITGQYKDRDDVWYDFNSITDINKVADMNQWKFSLSGHPYLTEVRFEIEGQYNAQNKSSLVQIEYHLSRPAANKDTFISKYYNEKIYTDFDFYDSSNSKTIGLDSDAGNIYFKGNVGIGTAGPDASLEVINGTTNGGFMVSSAAEANGDLFIVDEGGNVGIGTVSPSEKLVVVGTPTGTGILITSGSTYQSSGLEFAYHPSQWHVSRIRGQVQGGGGGDILFETAPSAAGAYDTKMVVLRGGNVGINTTTPLSTLHVNGTARFENQLNMTGSKITNLGTPTVGSDAATKSYVDIQVPGEGGWNDTGPVVKLVTKTDSVNATNIFINNSVQGNTLFVNGSAVGIGTSSPSYKLSVSDGTNEMGFAPGTTPYWYNKAAGSFRIETDKANTSTYLNIRGKGTGTGNLRLYDQDYAEYLDIGAVNQVGAIAVRGTTPGILSLQWEASNHVAMFRYSAEGETKELQIYGRRTGDSLRYLEIGVGVDAADTASFDGVSNYYFDGNVGIGTNLPSAKLDVVGDIEVNSTTPRLFLMESDTSNQNFRLQVTGGVFYLSKVDDDKVSNIKHIFAVSPTTGRLEAYNDISVLVGNKVVLNAGDTSDNYLITSGDDVEIYRQGTLNVDMNANGVTFPNTNVGIGTDSPETYLEVAGPEKNMYNGLTHLKDVGHYVNGAAFINGTMKITLPVNYTNSMMNVRIVGEDYGVTGAWEVVLNAYAYAGTGTFYAKTAEIRGSAPFNTIRTAYDPALQRPVILLGVNATRWSYPRVSIADVTGTLYQLGGEWTIELINDESGLNMSQGSTFTIHTYMDSSGNFGFGTVTPGATLPSGFNGDSYSKVVEIRNRAYNRDSGLFIRDYDGNPGIDIWADNSDGDVYIDSRTASADADIIFRTYTSSTPAERLRIKGSGNVGIGTGTPLSTLHVNGTARFEGQLNMTGSKITNLGTPTVGTDATTKSYVDTQITGEGGWNDTGTIVRLVTGGDALNATNLFINNSVDGKTMFINGSAVGIGTTSPNYILETFSSDGVVRFLRDKTTVGDMGALYLGGKNAVGTLKTYAHIIADAYDVGDGSEDAQLRFEVMNNGGVGTIPFVIRDTGEVRIGGGNAETAPSMVVNYAAGGNVGIGTSSPQAKLHVNGSINAIDYYGSGQHLEDLELTSGLVLYLPFQAGQPLKDFSGEQNDGINYGATWNYTGGYNGLGAYEFNGSGEYVKVSSSDIADIPSNITVMAWVYPHSNNTDEQIVFTGYRPGFWFFASDTVNHGFAVYISDSDASNYTAGVSTQEISPNSWYHVAFTFDGSNISIYLNGEVEQSTDQSIVNDTSNSGASAYIGSWSGTQQHFNGTIDEVMVYNRTLSAEEVKRLYEQRKTEPYYNGTPLFLDHNNNRIGIGTTTPTSTLDVSGNASVSSNFTVDGGTLYVDATDNRVGIGTSSPETKLDVQGPSSTTWGGRIMAHDDGSYNPYLNFYRWTGTAASYYPWRMLVSDTGLYVKTGSPANISSESYTVDALTILNSGNIGIGTISPGAKLHINGTGVLLNVSNASQSFLYVDQATGRVGIGTSSPQAKLHVNGTVRFENQLNMTGSRIINLGAPIAGTDAATVTYVNDQIAGSISGGWNDTGILVELAAGSDSVNATNVYIDNTVQGNTMFVNGSAVGIGTSSPSYLLHVNGTAEFTGNINFNDGDNNPPDILWFNGTTVIGGLGHSADRMRLRTITELPLAIETNDTERMRIDSVGKVGIGTASPTQKLQVIGNVSASARLIENTTSFKGISSEGLVLNMHFDDASGTVITDWSGYNNHGAASGSPVWTSGKFGTAMDFDGADDWINAGNDNSLKTKNITVEMWFKADSFPGTNNWTCLAGMPPNLTVSSMRWELIFNENDLEFYIGDGSDGAFANRANVPTGDWHHVVATYDITTTDQRLYFDGILADNDTGITMQNYGTNNLEFGEDCGGASNAEYWDGKIDSVSIYNRVFSAEEVLSHYLRESELVDIYKNQFIKGNLTINNSVLFVDSTAGQVGIGTSSPASILTIGATSGTNRQIVYDIAEGGATATNLDFGTIFDSSTTFRGGMRVNYSDAGGGNSDTKLQFYVTEGGVATTEAMRIDEAGNVGIGTSSPSQLLHINETSGNNYLQIETGDSSDAGNFFKNADTSWYHYLHSSGKLYTYDSQSGSTVMAIENGTGNVGIGTSSPQKMLHLNGSTPVIRLQTNGSTNAGVQFYNDTTQKGYIAWDETDDVMKFIAGTGITADHIVIDSSGNVGIGTSSPSSKLQVGDYNQGANAQADTTLALVNPDGQAGLVFTSKRGDAATTQNVGGIFAEASGGWVSKLHFNTSNNWGNPAVNAMTIYGDKVGIGTSSPSHTLNVVGDANITGTIINTDFTTLTDNSMADTLHRHSELSASDGTPDAVLSLDVNGAVTIDGVSAGDMLTFNRDTSALDNLIRFRDDGVNKGWMGVAKANSIVTGIGDNDFVVRAQDGQNLILTTRSTAPDFIIDSGKVGIGTVSPATTLHLNTSSGVTTLTIESASDATIKLADAGGVDWTFGTDNSLSDAFVIAGSDGLSTDPKLVIEAGGDVGIGTSAPSWLLDVKKDTTGNVVVGIENTDTALGGSRLHIKTASGTGDGSILYTADGTNYWAMGYDNSDSDKFKISYNADATIHNGNIVTYTTGGNVGINTSSPSHKLNVVGDANITGDLYVKGSDIKFGDYYARGAKTISVGSTYTTVLSVNLGGDHKSAFVKIWYGGFDWGTHSAPSYYAEITAKDGAGSYGEPGSIRVSHYWAPNCNDYIEAQLTHTANDITNIQLRTNNASDTWCGGTSATSANTILAYEVMGTFTSIT